MKDKSNKQLLSLTYKIGEVQKDLLTISSYSDTFVKIESKRYNLPLCIIGNNIFQWNDKNYLNLNLEIVKNLFDDSNRSVVERIEVVVIGLSSGKINNLIELKNKSMNAKLPLEIMKHDAACRTINILSMEGRKILAIII